MSRDISFQVGGSAASVRAKGDTVDIVSHVTTTSPVISDYGINAVNVLIKYESGIQLRGTNSISVNNGAYSGDINILYAIKPDGSSWKSNKEINHTQDNELRYYDNFAEAKKHGEIVAILLEYRNGVWTNGSLDTKMEMKADGDSGKSYVAVQDVKAWRGDVENDESWAGSNGAKVSHGKAPTDFMKPYDNPDNNLGNQSDRVYRRDEWPEGALEPIQIEGDTWGDTLFVLGGKVTANYSESKNLNGLSLTTLHGVYNETWSNSTLDIGLNQRTADRVFSFDVTGAGTKELSLAVDLDAENYSNADYMEQKGEVYLGTDDNPVTYHPNSDPTQPGSFSGGTIINPQNFTVPGDGKYQIYYSSDIGDTSDISKDPKAGVIWHESRIKLLPDSIKDASVTRKTAAYATTIIKTGSKGVSKKSISVSAKDVVGYELTMTSDKTKEGNTYILDVLPYNNDGRGTNYHGSYKLKDNKLSVKYSSLSGGIKSEGKIFYTTDMEVRENGRGTYDDASIFKGIKVENLSETFQAGGSTYRLAKNNGDGTWSVPDNVSPTAIAFCGAVGADERVAITVELALTGNKTGDIYNNVSSNLLDNTDSALESNNASVTIGSRSISGVAWLDADKNGIYDKKTDKILENVGVELYRKDGTQIKSDANGSKYGNIKTGADGSYEFLKVPENEEGYFVRFIKTDEFNIKNYLTADKNKNGASTPYEKDDDSDVFGKGEPLNFAQTDNFKLYSDEKLAELGVVNQSADGINAGFKEGYSVDYEFVSGTKDKELPDKVKELLPKDEKKYNQGSKAKAIQPAKTVVNVSDGIWTFKGYDEEEKTVAQNLKFTGTWEFTLKAGTINHIPYINADDKTIFTGDIFDPLKDVSAYDTEDGNILLDKTNVIENKVDVNKAGVYQVTYKVTDSQGAFSLKTITVNVKNKEAEKTESLPSDSNIHNDTDNSKKNLSPKTGDNMNMEKYFVLLGISFCLLILLPIIYKRKNQKR